MRPSPPRVEIERRPRLKSPYTWKDHLTRLLFIAAGVVAAMIFVETGDAEALPPLALGGMLGAMATGWFSQNR